MSDDLIAGRQVFTSNAPKLGFSPALDGLRAISILMVFGVHANFEIFGSFASGVDVFFVVSGFLITTLLLEERRNDGRIDVRRFYLRRALRLLPALFAVLAFTMVGALATGNSAFIHDAWNDVLSSFFYVYHVVHPAHLAELTKGRLPSLRELRPLIQLWSLSVEEHFYLVVAFLLAFVTRRRLVTQLGIAFVGLWVACSAARLGGLLGPRLFLYQRPDSLLLGVAAAVLNANLPTELSERQRRIIGRVGVGGAVLVVAVVFVGTKFAKLVGLWARFIAEPGRTLQDGMYWPRFGFSLCALGATAIVLCVVRVPEHRLSRLLSWRPLLPIGRRSYVLYLFHVPVFIVLLKLFPAHENAVPLMFLVAFPVIAEGVHRLIEKPALRLKNRFEAPGISGVPVR